MNRFSKASKVLSFIAATAFSCGVIAAPTASSPNKQRAELTYKIVKKWGGHVQDTYSLPARTWAMEMVPLFRLAPMDAMQLAADAKSFDAMNDALLQTKSANSNRTGLNATAGRTVSLTGKKFGEATQDLVFTPLEPCRVIDTRVSVPGVIPANSTRNFFGIGAPTYAYQGGKSGKCDSVVSSDPIIALAINFTAVNPVVPQAGGGGPGTGFITVFPLGSTQPTAATMVLKDGVSLSNSAIVKIPFPLGQQDFTIYSSSQTHVVADLVGYFAPPQATALECVDTISSLASIAAGVTGSATSVSCPTTFTPTATNCLITNQQLQLLAFSRGQCRWKNTGTTAASGAANYTCCRLPGR